MLNSRQNSAIARATHCGRCPMRAWVRRCRECSSWTGWRTCGTYWHRLRTNGRGSIPTTLVSKIGLLRGVDIELDRIPPELLRQMRLDKKVAFCSQLPRNLSFHLPGAKCLIVADAVFLCRLRLALRSVRSAKSLTRFGSWLRIRHLAPDLGRRLVLAQTLIDHLA